MVHLSEVVVEASCSFWMEPLDDHREEPGHQTHSEQPEVALERSVFWELAAQDLPKAHLVWRCSP